MDEWLTAARDRIADATGVPATALDLGEDDAAALLDLARVAAHESGDRRNAPLACFLLGLAIGRAPGAELASAAKAAGASPTTGGETS